MRLKLNVLPPDVHKLVQGQRLCRARPSPPHETWHKLFHSARPSFFGWGGESERFPCHRVWFIRLVSVVPREGSGGEGGLAPTKDQVQREVARLTTDLRKRRDDARHREAGAWMARSCLTFYILVFRSLYPNDSQIKNNANFLSKNCEPIFDLKMCKFSSSGPPSKYLSGVDPRSPGAMSRDAIGWD